MILFVFEGKNRESTLFKIIEYVYFSNNTQIRICSYKNNRLLTCMGVQIN